MPKHSLFGRPSAFSFWNVAFYMLVLSSICFLLAAWVKTPEEPVQEIKVSIDRPEQTLHTIHLKEQENLVYHILRDLGIAFLVAIIVTGVYDLHERSRGDHERIEDTLSQLIDDIVDVGVWKEVKAQVIESTMIRENVDIRLKIMPEPPPSNRAVLEVEFGYDLRGLRVTPDRYVVNHQLDKHISGSGLPCFDKINVGYQWLSGADGEHLLDVAKVPGGGKVIIKEGDVEIQNILLGGAERKMKITTLRRELVYMPGTYCLFMNILTKGVNELVVDAPDNVETIVAIRPHLNGLIVEDPGKVWRYKPLLLRGQCVEFRFKAKEAKGVREVGAE